LNQAIFQISIRSIRAALNHLRLIDLTELAADAQQYGTPEDHALIIAVAKALETLPPGH
jgi:hypothetical protein